MNRRKRLAAEVFGNEAKRRELEARLHPLVKERIGEWLDTVPAASRRVALAGVPVTAPRSEDAAGTVGVE